MLPVPTVNVADMATPPQYWTGWRHATSSTYVNAVPGAFYALWCGSHFGMSCACHLCWWLLTFSILNRREGSTIGVATISLPCSVTWHALQYELFTPFLLFTTNHLNFQQGQVAPYLILPTKNSSLASTWLMFLHHLHPFNNERQPPWSSPASTSFTVVDVAGIAPKRSGPLNTDLDGSFEVTQLDARIGVSNWVLILGPCCWSAV